MIYLVAQIVLCLLFTFVIGITVGWLVRGLGTSRQTETVEANWRARLAELQQRTGSQPPAEESAAPVIEDLRDQLRQRDEAIAQLRAEGLDASSTGDKALARRVKESNELCERLQGHLADQRSAASQLEARLARAAGEKEILVGRLRDRESEIGRMSQERQHAINTIASLQKDMRALRGAQLRQSETVAAAPPKPVASTPSVPAEPERQRALPIAEPAKPAPAARYEPGWRLTEPRGQKDNLQAIFGVGPKLERQLNDLGIFHFEQIAAFTNDDIVWVARHLKSFPGRIVRDRWLQQAASLLQRKNGRTPE